MRKFFVELMIRLSLTIYVHLRNGNISENISTFWKEGKWKTGHWEMGHFKGETGHFYYLGNGTFYPLGDGTLYSLGTVKLYHLLTILSPGNRTTYPLEFGHPLGNGPRYPLGFGPFILWENAIWEMVFTR